MIQPKPLEDLRPNKAKNSYKNRALEREIKRCKPRTHISEDNLALFLARSSSYKGSSLTWENIDNAVCAGFRRKVRKRRERHVRRSERG